MVCRNPFIEIAKAKQGLLQSITVSSCKSRNLEFILFCSVRRYASVNATSPRACCPPPLPKASTPLLSFPCPSKSTTILPKQNILETTKSLYALTSYSGVLGKSKPHYHGNVILQKTRICFFVLFLALYLNVGKQTRPIHHRCMALVLLLEIGDDGDFKLGGGGVGFKSSRGSISRQAAPCSRVHETGFDVQGEENAVGEILCLISSSAFLFSLQDKPAGADKYKA